MAYELIKTEQHGQVEILKLNDPEALNAISHQMVEELTQELERVEDDPSVRALVLTGEGRGFCAGANIKRMAAEGVKQVEKSDGGLAELTPHLTFIRKAEYQLWRLSKTTIAAINGPCITTGFGLSIACDFRIASDQARFGWIFARRGLPPDDGSLTLLIRTLGYPAVYKMGMLKELFPAQEALDIGFVQQVVPHDQLMTTCMDIANQVIDGVPPMAQRMFKRLAQAAIYEDHESVYLRVREAFNVLIDDPDHQEAVQAYTEKRKPVWSSTPRD
jgi:enoyl-CoA hydratase/carnithine racemase